MFFKTNDSADEYIMDFSAATIINDILDRGWAWAVKTRTGIYNSVDLSSFNLNRKEYKMNCSFWG